VSKKVENAYSRNARSKRGKKNDIYFQVTGDMWLFWIPIQGSIVRVDWFSVGRLMFVG